MVRAKGRRLKDKGLCHAIRTGRRGLMNELGSHTEHKSKRAARWVAPLVVVALVLLALALFYVEENWRGEYVWRRAKKELEAKGEILDWKYYLREPPPDE